MGLNLSISNIAWDENDNLRMYDMLKKCGYSGIEIAPTRLFGNSPYNRWMDAKKYSENLIEHYGLKISSVQSIWYGRTEKMFESDVERKFLIEYTKQAINFAEHIGAYNLVFGCPKNRCINSDEDELKSVSFFKELGEYAFKHHTVLAIEANPAIYGTNFINTTSQAISLIRKVSSPGFKLNLDFGTIIENNESLDILNGNMDLINHVHISEPYLARIQPRTTHIDLIKKLKKIEYQGFISIEMGKQNDLQNIYDIILYVKSICEG